ncbi:MAG TPA: CGNR zinc finger domain-containing protein [Ktedonobacterales bacterium]|nr:CGNR zinc finger domain-containing protein [Ktedonobacterales bacterium]
MGSVREASGKAPGRLRLAQAFVNTRFGSGKQLHEALGSEEEARAWLVRHGLLSEDAHISEGDVRRMRDAREALRTLLRANTPARHDSAQSSTVQTTPERIVEAQHALNAIAAYAPLTVRFDDAGHTALEPDIAGVEGALARLLSVAPLAQADGTWRRLKICAHDACGVAFYDRSKNHSGVWCAMERCGNRVNARASRARRRNTSAVAERRGE